MTYKYVNAGLKSKAEAIKRLLDGEVFFRDNCKIYYDETTDYANPFIIENEFDKEVLNLSWATYSKWTIQVIPRWYDNLGEGILCWASNDENDENGWVEKIVTGYDEGFIYPFNTRLNRWKYARPMTKEEITKYTIKE